MCDSTVHDRRCMESSNVRLSCQQDGRQSTNGGRMRVRVLSVLAVLALAAAPKSARAQGEALLTGKVTSVAGAPVEGAQVYLDKMALGTQSKADGSYRFTVPAAGAAGQGAP